MTQWPSGKAKRVLPALQALGWAVKRQSRSHRTLSRRERPDNAFAFHEGDQIGPRMLTRLAKHTGLEPDDLR
jgi:predicted RNA binding protein YcfA (HicA-like mRNA interferase family)